MDVTHPTLSSAMNGNPTTPHFPCPLYAQQHLCAALSPHPHPPSTTFDMDHSCLELTIAIPGLCSTSSGSEGDGGSNMRDLDMNQPACEMEEECFAMGTMDDDEDGSNPKPKKLRLSKEQSRLLEESFRLNQTLNPKQKEALAFKLKLRPRQVEVWFQNRRARTKLKQTEMECEYLKRCFGSLTEENRRLQREVEELRALRVAPPTVISPHTSEPMLASSITMCPRCERVSASGSGETRGWKAAIGNGGVGGGLTVSRGSAFQPRQQSSPVC